MSDKSLPSSVVMLGATGAVGGHTVQTLIKAVPLQRLSLLGRRPVAGLNAQFIEQHAIDIFDSKSYQAFLAGHQAAICTLGVGEPSKMSKEEFVKIDRDAVLEFATACKQAGVRHFELLGAVGSSADSFWFYVRTKGELEEGLKALNFERLSLFRPSMIMTPTNRYGITQGIILTIMPAIDTLLIGSMRKFRSIRVEKLGATIAMNLLTNKQGVEILHWDDFMALSD